MVSPFIFHSHNPLFQEVLTPLLFGHGHEGSAAKNKVNLLDLDLLSRHYAFPSKEKTHKRKHPVQIQAENTLKK